MLTYIDVLTPADVLLGYGPITSAVNVAFGSEMDRAAPFSFSIPATDPQADLLAEKRRLRFYGVLNGLRTELGDGVIDTLAYRGDDAGRWWIDVSGFDRLIELAGYTALQLTMSNGSTGVPEPPSYGIDLLRTSAVIYSGVLWNFNTYGTEPSVELYGQFQDESILRALAILCSRAGAHFRYDGSRNLTVFYEWEASGIRAIQANGALPSDACAIAGSLKKTVESAGLMTRILPRGSGNSTVRLDLRACTRSTPTGYVVNKTTIGSIENTAAKTAYGDITKPVEFKDITPLSATDADLEYAANQLFDAAKITLDRSLTPGIYYAIKLAGCNVRLKPGQTLRVIYRDDAANINIDADLYILNAKIQPSPLGYITTEVTVSTIDQWAINDRDIITNRIAEGKTYQSSPQLNANSYTTAYTVHIDDTETGSFRFVFGPEVVQMQRVFIDFQLNPFESTVKSVAGSSTTTASGGGGTSADAGTHTHSVTLTAHTHTVTISAHTHTVTIPAHSHSVTVAAHTHTVSVAAHSHTVTISSHTHTVAIADHDHSVPNHNHYFNIDPGSGGGTVQVFSGGGSPDFGSLVGNGIGGQIRIATNPSTGATTSGSGGSDTRTSSNGGSSTPSTTDGGSQTPTSSSGGGTTPSTTELASSSPTSSSGGSATPTTSSGGGTLETAASAGTHSHTVSAHTHTLTPLITAVYGIYRAAAPDTYGISDLEYRLNSGSWANLSGATARSGGWYRLDITSLIYSSTTFRPLAEDNSFQVRRKSVAASGKTVMMDALLYVRNIIQANIFSG